MKIYGASPSALKCYELCQFKYHLTYETNLPEIKAESFATVQGKCIHSVLERYANGEKDWAVVLKEVLLSERPWRLASDKKLSDPNCGECALYDAPIMKCNALNKEVTQIQRCPFDIYNNCVNMVQTGVNRSDEPFKGKIISTEFSFKEDLGSYKLSGRIDLVTEVDKDTVKIRDWKTGRPEKTENVRNDLQAKVYDLAGSLLWPQYKRRLVVFDYLEAKEPITIEFESSETADSISYIADRVEDIKKNTNPNRNTGYWCKYMCIGKEKCDQFWAANLLKRHAAANV